MFMLWYQKKLLFYFGVPAVITCIVRVLFQNEQLKMDGWFVLMQPFVSRGRKIIAGTNDKLQCRVFSVVADFEPLFFDEWPQDF